MKGMSFDYVTAFTTGFFLLYKLIKSFFVIIPNYNQQDATLLDLFISTDALHVSGGSSAHHQEHITVHTASDIVNQYCSKQLYWLTVCTTVCTVMCS